MENNGLHHPTIVLQLKKFCGCDKCVRNLRKILLRIDGVNGVDVEPKKDLLTVTGEVDPTLLINYLESKKLNTELMHYERDKKSGGGSHDENAGGGGSGKAPHVVERYTAPKIDPAVCRDPYCKLHKCRPIFHSKVPPRHSGDHPHHTSGGGYPFSRPGESHGIQQPIMFDDQNPFAYDGHSPTPMMMPPPPFHPAETSYGAGYMPSGNFRFNGGPPPKFGGPFM